MDYVERCPLSGLNGRHGTLSRYVLRLPPGAVIPLPVKRATNSLVLPSKGRPCNLVCDAVLSGAVVAWLNGCECWPVWQRANDTVLCVCIVWSAR